MRRRQRPARGGRGTEKQPTILVYGESDNDTKAIAELMQGLEPALEGRVQARREPPVLLREARPDAVPDRAQRIARATLVEGVRYDVKAIIAHEDCDAVEPAHEALAEKIETALRAEGCAAHAATPAWELETWWFQWPDAVAAVGPSWDRLDDYRGRHVGLITDSKEELKRALRRSFDARKRKRVRTYQESDAPQVARNVRSLGQTRRPEARSDSYRRFVGCVEACAEGI